MADRRHNRDLPHPARLADLAQRTAAVAIVLLGIAGCLLGARAVLTLITGG